VVPTRLTIMGVVAMAKKLRTKRRIQQIVEDATRRVAIYIRRSTDEDHQPFSLDAQETKLRAFVASQPGDWQIVAVYSDDASGATADRPALQKALRAARAGLFDTLLVYRVDRFSRSLRDLTALLDDLDDAGIVFRSATEPFDTSTPVGRMLVQMLGVFAEFERETIIDRVINGMERKAAKGLWTGGARPLGYLIDRKLDRLVPEPAEAATVRMIFDRYTNDRLQASHAASSATHRDQLAMVNRELKEASAAIDRYLIAFEKGSLDDDDPNIRARLTTLKNQSKALRIRKAHLEYELDQPPQTLTPGDLGKIRRRVRHILTEGAPNAHKAMFEALIHEITITADDAVKPVFKLPLAGNDEGLALQGPALTTNAPNQTVRALPTMVGDTGIEPVTSSV
jgi:DNA invertase Pin-like site-specific DNA recombinase